MSKKTIEQQIAELTPEQKNNMGKIYKKYVLSLISIVLVGVILIIGIFAYASIREEQAKDEHDKIQATIELNKSNNTYDFSLYDESMEAIDEYYNIKQLKPLSLVIGGIVTMIGVVIVYVIFKKKYPYFSEKKYTYLKKMRSKTWQGI